MQQLNFPAEPLQRPAWRKWSSTLPQFCRSCGRKITEGWRVIGLWSEDPYLCRTCWADGCGIEF